MVCSSFSRICIIICLRAEKSPNKDCHRFCTKWGKNQLKKLWLWSSSSAIWKRITYKNDMIPSETPLTTFRRSYIFNEYLWAYTIEPMEEISSKIFIGYDNQTLSEEHVLRMQRNNLTNQEKEQRRVHLYHRFWPTYLSDKQTFP